MRLSRIIHWLPCHLGKHTPETVYEQRAVYRGTLFPFHLHSSHNAKKFSHYKTGYYDICKYCGKKLSNFTNIKKI